MNDKINHICIIGAGFMGSQLALHFAFFVENITLIETSFQSTATAKKMHEKELQSRVSSGNITPRAKEDILKRIRFMDNIHMLPSTADLVIEAVPEDLELKQKIFFKLDQICSPHTILATNSSSIHISQIEGSVNRQDKLINTHFYPFVWDKPVVEVMKGSKTSDDTLNKIITFAKQVDLTPLVVKKESTGFIFNRIWRAIKKEALHLADDGVTSFEDIDRAWMILLKSPIGPFGLMDMVGLDVVRDIEMVYYNESGAEGDLPPKILLEKIREGNLGRKTGRGFYSYPDPAFLEPMWLKGESK